LVGDGGDTINAGATPGDISNWKSTPFNGVDSRGGSPNAGRA
jgi:hypothetical protein